MTTNYGEKTMAKLNSLLTGSDRKNLTVASDFWAWRDENKNRKLVLNRAGLVLTKENGWKADMSNVTAESLVAALASVKADAETYSGTWKDTNDHYTPSRY